MTNEQLTEALAARIAAWLDERSDVGGYALDKHFNDDLRKLIASVLNESGDT